MMVPSQFPFDVLFGPTQKYVNHDFLFFHSDLRQDMLTLQIMTIMDNLWKELGLDLRCI